MHWVQLPNATRAGDVPLLLLLAPAPASVRATGPAPCSSSYPVPFPPARRHPRVGDPLNKHDGVQRWTVVYRNRRPTNCVYRPTKYVYPQYRGHGHDRCRTRSRSDSRGRNRSRGHSRGRLVPTTPLLLPRLSLLPRLPPTPAPAPSYSPSPTETPEKTSYRGSTVAHRDGRFCTVSQEREAREVHAGCTS